MSKGKGPIERSAHFLKELGNRARQNIYISPDMAMRQPAQSMRASRRILLVTAVVLMVIAMAVGDGLWNAGTTIAAQSENYALTEPLRIAAVPAAAPLSLLLVAQNQDSAAPPDDGVRQSQPEAPPPAAEGSVAIHPRAASRSEPNKDLSDDLSEYLHKHHLPYVDALVFSSASGRPTLVKLSGQVRTEHGKEDAESKSSDFLNQTGLRMQNHIEVDAGLASSVPASSSASIVPASSPGSAAGAPMAAAPTDRRQPLHRLVFKGRGSLQYGLPDSSCRRSHRRRFLTPGARGAVRTVGDRPEAVQRPVYPNAGALHL